MRAATSPELAKLRGDGQSSRLYLAFADQATVFAAMVNQTFTTTDQVALITFDTVTIGAYTNLQEGMTLYVGSAAGLLDLGMARIKSASSTTIKIGRTSDIAWADNLYLTAVRDFGLWAKQPLLDKTGTRLDDDLEYIDQLTNMRPVPVLGPDALLRLVSGSAIYHPTAAASWVPASSVSGYSWAVTPSSSVTITSGTSATPTITFTNYGTYDLACTITAANGTSTLGHRTVRVVGGAEAPVTEFTLDSLTGDIANGGWSATVTLYAQADTTAVKDRGKVFIYADDYYGGALSSLGQVTELEHQVFVGWIDGESMEYDTAYGTVQFTISGPAAWLNKIGGTATYIEPVTTTPTNWNQMQNCTLALIVWYFASWRSTAAQVMDILQPSLANTFGGVTVGMGTLWSQITDAASNRLLREGSCDRYGRLSFDRDPQCMTTSERAALPVVMAFTQEDCQDKISFDRKITPDTGVLEMSGLAFSGSTTSLVMSRSSGWAMKRFGKPETRDRIIATDQADANRIAGCLSAKANNPYPRVTLKLAQNNRMLDVAPASYCTLSIAAGDTPRGIAWTDQRIIARKISLTYNAGTGAPSVSVEFEPEVQPAVAVTVDVPTIAKINVPTQPALPGPTISPFTSPWMPNVPITVPVVPTVPDTGSCPVDAAANGPFPIYFTGTIYNNTTTSIWGYFGDAHFKARATGASNPTTVIITMKYEEFAGGWVENLTATWASAYLCDASGTRICTGTISGTGSTRTITFSPPANVYFPLLEITINSTNVFSVTSVVKEYESEIGVSDSMTWSNSPSGLAIRWEAQYTIGDNFGGRVTLNAKVTTAQPNTYKSLDIYAHAHRVQIPDLLNWYSIGVFGNIGRYGYLTTYEGVYGSCEKQYYTAQKYPWPALDDTNTKSDIYVNHPARYEVNIDGNGVFYAQAMMMLQRSIYGNGIRAGGTFWTVNEWLINNIPTKRLTVAGAVFYNLCS